METGLRTHELSPTGATLEGSIPQEGAQFDGHVFCRNCRVHVHLDDMDTHDCSSSGVKPCSQSLRAPTVIKRASSFLDSFLDAPDTALLLTTPPNKSKLPGTRTSTILDADLGSKQSHVSVRAGEPTTRSHVGRSVSVDATPVRRTDARMTRLSSESNLTLPPKRIISQVQQAIFSPESSFITETRPSENIVHGDSETPIAADGPRTGRKSALSTQSNNTSSLMPFESSVMGIRAIDDKFLAYSIVTVLREAGSSEFVVERRYREFYAFACTVHSMMPSPELWNRLPPKTYCSFLAGTHSAESGFSLRRKFALDDFLQSAVEMICHGSNRKDYSIAEWYLLRHFLQLPDLSTASTPFKDRDLGIAMNELTHHACESNGWVVVGRQGTSDTTFIKTGGGFDIVKRVKTCSFPARAIFDMITQSSHTRTVNSSPRATATKSDSPFIDQAKSHPNWNSSMVELCEVLRRENRQFWTERVVFKGGLLQSRQEMINLKNWRVDEGGRTIIVMIPAPNNVWQDPARHNCNDGARVDCVLGGWVITPIPGKEACTVTWLMQVNFGQCNPEGEFAIPQGVAAYRARRTLLGWADEIIHLHRTLEKEYDAEHYRNIGPLLSCGDLQKLKLARQDSSRVSLHEDPRAFVLANEMEPSMCLLVHKNNNANVLVFRVNHCSISDLSIQTPITAEWIMFEKIGNPRHALSAIERNTTFSFSVRRIGPNIFRFSLDLLRRDCILRSDPEHGYAMFTTINGKPNTHLKRVYITYAQMSILGLSKISAIVLFGTSEMETINMNTSTRV